MLVDGIYSVHFETLAGQGDGIVVVAGGTLRGGDATFVYYGRVENSENGFTAEIETTQHSQGRASVFGMESVHIHLTGKSDGLDAICTGTAVEVPGLIFKATLKFLHE
jgi:T3SS negative regulator,GrlR